jgi:NAD(P)-dependent dehydrogenase (short-subunit alcohol dehydrogenase family)
MAEGIKLKSVEGLRPLSEVFVESMKTKTAIVTGGATGLGYCVVNRLAEAGAKVVIGGDDEAGGKKAESEFRAKGYKVSFRKTDVRNVDECYALTDFAVKEYGGADILVMSAATWSMYAFLDMPEAEYDRVVDTNMKGEYFMAQAAARQMVRSKTPGKIVLIASVAYRASDCNGTAMMTHYNACKGGVVSMTKGIAKELKQYGVNVNCVAPGGMTTHGALLNGAESGGLYGQEYLDIRSANGRLTPRATTPDEVALLVFAMCTDMANFMYGETVVADGGAILSFQEKPWSYTVEDCVPGPKAG